MTLYEAWSREHLTEICAAQQDVADMVNARGYACQAAIYRANVRDMHRELERRQTDGAAP